MASISGIISKLNATIAELPTHKIKWHTAQARYGSGSDGLDTVFVEAPGEEIAQASSELGPDAEQAKYAAYIAEACPQNIQSLLADRQEWLDLTSQQAARLRSFYAVAEPVNQAIIRDVARILSISLTQL